VILAILPTAAFLVAALARVDFGRRGDTIFFVSLAVVQGLSVVLAIVAMVRAGRGAGGMAWAATGLALGVLGSLFMFLVVGLALGTLLGTSG
jgi:uncharacterized protein YqgC (DUF456 family)